jgi:hypothetical protein
VFEGGAPALGFWWKRLGASTEHVEASRLCGACRGCAREEAKLRGVGAASRLSLASSREHVWPAIREAPTCSVLKLTLPWDRMDMLWATGG